MTALVGRPTSMAAHTELLLPTENTSTPQSLSQASGRNMKIQRRKCVIVVICALIVAFVTACAYSVRFSPEFSQYRIVRTYPTESDDRMPRTILLWNSFFHRKRWGLSEDTVGPAYFRDELKCPVYHCEISNNHDFLPALDMYDAVLFHTAEPFHLLHPLPAVRSARQLYVFALMEPPGETKHKLSDEGSLYNLTMTYRLDSDIVWSYKYIVDNESGVYVAPSTHPIWRQPPSQWNDTAVWQLWSGKTRTAAWFVSHCETLSKREQLAAKLQKYIDVDIFGKCGSLSCPYKSEQCDDLLDQKYKFYFSFENSLCTDYVTEKLYNALERNIVPVVFGGANYTRFVPPHSYINAEDFESAAALAAYLTYLAAHPAEYTSYFWWRRYYRLGYLSPFCQLCEKLQSVTYRQKSQTYTNIEKWWLGGSCRFESKIQF